MNKELQIQSEDDVIKAIDEGEATPEMRWIWVLGLGGVFFEAYESTALASGLGPLAEQLNFTASQIGLLTSLSMLLAIVLCPITGAMADKYGRLPIILYAKAFAFIAMAMAVVASDYYILLLSRVFAGIAWAMDFGVVMAYLSEFIPRRHQQLLNRWQSMWYVATTSNLAITAGIYQFGVGEAIWRYSLATAGVFALVMIVLQIWKLPESPRWLAAKGRYADAANALRVVYDVKVTVSQHRPVAKDPTSSASETQSNGLIKSLGELFGHEYRSRTALASIPGMMQAVQYYAIGWYLPVIALQLFGAGFTSATLGVALFNLFGVIGGASSASLSKWLRVRRAIQLGFFGSAVILLIFGLTFHNIPFVVSIALPCLFILVHSALAAPGYFSLAATAYPSRLRGVGMGFTTMAVNTGSAIGLFCFPLLQSEFGPGAAIAITVVAPLIGLVTTSIVRWDPEIDQSEPESETIVTATASQH